jgi:hypothetical protein
LCEDVTLLGLNFPYCEAQEVLARMGVDMSVKRIRHIAGDMAKLSLELRKGRVAEAVSKPSQAFAGNPPFAGRRIAVLIDGGRIQIRSPKQAGKSKGNDKRRKKGKQDRRYNTDWREPKIFVIYEYDENGKRLKGSRQYCDGTIGNPDDLLKLLIAELKINGAYLADEVTFLADGAIWIWKSIDRIVSEAGISHEKVVKVLDYYHAVEHLAAFAENGWNKKEVADEMLKELKKLLLCSPGELMAKLRNKSRNGGATLKREYKYFKKNREAINYAEAKTKKIPIGSGAVESAIRRVVNLRLKSAGMFWNIENAEGLLHLRCQLKSGNWKNFYSGLLKIYSECG